MNKSSTRPDLRVIKTRRAIQEAFVALLEEKPFSDVTVQEIVDAAEINRKTFYNHYRDKYDLADQIMKSFAVQIEELAKNMRDDPDNRHIEAINNLLQQRRIEALSLWDVRTDTTNGLKSLVRQVLASMYIPIAQEAGETEETISLQAEMYANIASMVLRFALEHADCYSVLEMQQNLAVVYKHMVRLHAER